MTTIDLTDIREMLADRDMEIIGLRAACREQAAQIAALKVEAEVLQSAQEPAKEDTSDGSNP